MPPNDPEARPVLPKPNEGCPVCGGPNGCAPAACGSFDVDCWCTRTSFAPGALERVPAELRGEACLCVRCATAPGLPDGGGARDADDRA